MVPLSGDGKHGVSGHEMQLWLVPVRVQLDVLERHVCPDKDGAPTGFALGRLGKKGVNSDFISIHEEPPVIL